jgi:hypothetical protein
VCKCVTYASDNSSGYSSVHMKEPEPGIRDAEGQRVGRGGIGHELLPAVAVLSRPLSHSTVGGVGDSACGGGGGAGGVDTGRRANAHKWPFLPM